MPVYFATGYFVRPGKVTEYQQWLNSEEASRLAGQIEKESGMKYLGTYWTILGLGDYDCEDWWVAPNWAAADKSRESKADEEWSLKTYDFMDLTRSAKTRVFRTTKDVKITEPPPKQ
jgi:hypothetical protein